LITHFLDLLEAQLAKCPNFLIKYSDVNSIIKKLFFKFSGYEQHISPSLADLEVLVSAASSCLSNIFDVPSSSTEHFPQLDNIPSPKQQKCNKIMSKKAADIIASYKFALEQCNSSAYQELFQFFRQMFHADSSRILTREITMPLLTKMSEEFKTFAFLQRFVQYYVHLISWQ
jgi:hypothetical protein